MKNTKVKKISSFHIPKKSSITSARVTTHNASTSVAKNTETRYSFLYTPKKQLWNDIKFIVYYEELSSKMKK